MSLIGSYRHSGVLSTTSLSSSTSIINFTGFKPSGITDGNILGVGLYVWSGALSTGYWKPLQVRDIN